MKKIAIIGGGVAGYTCAMELSKSFDITLYEKDLIGGTCVNKGCIPLKYFVYRRELLDEIKKAGDLFVNIFNSSLDMKKVQADKESKIAKIRQTVLTNLKNNKVKIIFEEAGIDGKDVISKNEKNSFDIIIIATGSKPVKNTFFEIEDKAPVSFSSDDFIDIQNIPENLAVIGAGYIGLELACIFSAFGSTVTVFEKSDRILSGFEAATSKSLEFRLKRNGINIIKNAGVKKINKNGSLIYHDNNNLETNVTGFSHILLSIGREVCMLNGLDVKKDEKGYIKVNNNYETSTPDVYGIGDVIGPPFFAHRGARQAHLLSSYLLTGTDNIGERLIPEVVFTYPELAKVGLDEDELKAKGIKYKSFKIPYGVLGKSVILDETGQLKILTDENEKIIGCVIIGKYASELIGYITLGISKELLISELKDITMPHPTFSELFLEMGLRYNKLL